MSKDKIGRNDPCPCGSGKKYKNCCLGSESEAETDFFTRCSQSIASVKLRLDQEFNQGIKKIRQEARQNFLRYSVENRLTEDRESLFSDWLWFDMADSDGDTLARDYLRNHGEYMSDSLKECLAALGESYLSVYEPVAVENGFLRLKDILTGIEDNIILKETPELNLAEKSWLMLGRLAALNEGKVFSGMVLILENSGEQGEFIISHFDYLKRFYPETDPAKLLKTNANIVYGLFDHAYHKKNIAINDIRALQLNTAGRITLQEMLDNSSYLKFVHDLENVRWYEVKYPEAYKRIGLGDDYAVSFISILEDLDSWDDILKDTFPLLEDWPIVNNRFIYQTPPDEFLTIWYNAIRDQETERWLKTPHNELGGISPAEHIKNGNPELVIELLDRLAAQVEENQAGGSLIKYIRQRVQTLQSVKKD